MGLFFTQVHEKNTPYGVIFHAQLRCTYVIREKNTPYGVIFSEKNTPYEVVFLDAQQCCAIIFRCTAVLCYVFSPRSPLGF